MELNNCQSKTPRDLAACLEAIDAAAGGKTFMARAAVKIVPDAMRRAQGEHMPTLEWIGKDKVVNHHLDVPYRVLEHRYTYMGNGANGAEISDGNKIIRGDNLEALKALLPQYEGRIKCIYIDPPYNTGNEGWVYNDNVNDPKIKKWLGEVVGKEGEDLSRHDKWLCMMYPRLRLLQRLLCDGGFIAISIDENELVNLGMILNEIFGRSNLLAFVPVRSEPSGGKGKEALRVGHEYLVVYCKNNASKLKLEIKNVYGATLTDEFGEYRKGRELSKWGSESLRQDRPDMWFPLFAPDGTEVFPIKNDGKEGRWRWGAKNKQILEILNNPMKAHWEMRAYDGNISIAGKNERWFPYEKIREAEKKFGWNTWLDNIGFNSFGTEELKAIFSEKVFDTPKPTSLVEWIINLMSDPDGMVLDSFAGSGTTAHAVLNMNKQDGGNRKFILVEMMDYAESITAERVRRVIDGYTYVKGKNKNLIDVKGTGGSFSFYDLGEPLLLENRYINEAVAVEKIREYVWFMETGRPLPQADESEPYLLGSHNRTAYYFCYEKNHLSTLDHAFLQSITTKADAYIIYADINILSDAELEGHHLIFKKIPRDMAKL